MLGLAVLSTFVGCYPEFGFAPTDSGVDDVAVDSSVADVGNDAIFPGDDTAAAMDTSGVDSVALDTRPLMDTAAPMDTAPPKDGCEGLTGWAFCRDFDSVTTVGSGWGGTYITGTAGLSLETTKSHSPSKSMKATIGPSSGVSAANAHENFTASSATHPLAVDFWAWFDAVPSGEGPLIMKISGDVSNRGLSIYLGEGGLAIDANAPSGTTNHKVPGTLSAGRWYHIRLEGILAATSSGWFKVYVDNMSTPVLTKTGLATTTVEATYLKLNVGFYTDTAPSVLTAWFDDVAFYWL